MTDSKLPTEFLDAEISSEEELNGQHEVFIKFEMLKIFMNSMPTSVLVLNNNRQVVCANKIFLESLQVRDVREIIGARPGDLFRCDHEAKSLYGCGTTKFCTVCGTWQALMEIQKDKSSIKECSITRDDAEALDFQIWTNPIKLNDETFTIYSILDKSDEKRRAALERIFFHDILNTAGGIKGFIELLEGANPEEMEEFIHISYELSERLIEEIESQRELIRAENNDLVIRPKPFSTYDMIKEIRTLYLSHYVAKNKIIKLNEDTLDAVMVSDKPIIRRVLGNLLKNALEAINDSETVTINCFSEAGNITYSVHSPSYITPVNQLQIFKRSFSTKGSGRGLGTYSIKLLTEKYLQGKASFQSSIEEGTTFFVSFPKEIK